MIERKVSVADLILIAGTRVALGAGLGLLLSNRLNKRNAAGLALALVEGLRRFLWRYVWSARKVPRRARSGQQGS